MNAAQRSAYEALPAAVLPHNAPAEAALVMLTMYAAVTDQKLARLRPVELSTLSPSLRCKIIMPMTVCPEYCRPGDTEGSVIP